MLNSYDVPMVTCFVAGILGFGHLIKIKDMCSREYDEKQVYAQPQNCQDYLMFDSDKIKAYGHHKAFQTSVRFLATKGVAEAQCGLFEFRHNNHIVEGDSGAVRGIRRLGV